MKPNYLSGLFAGLKITIGLAATMILYSCCNASTECCPRGTAIFMCKTCEVEFKKCSSCDVPPDEHTHVNHAPVHGDCKCMAKIIYK